MDTLGGTDAVVSALRSDSKVSSTLGLVYNNETLNNALSFFRWESMDLKQISQHAKPSKSSNKSIYMFKPEGSLQRYIYLSLK